MILKRLLERRRVKKNSKAKAKASVLSKQKPKKKGKPKKALIIKLIAALTLVSIAGFLNKETSSLQSDLIHIQYIDETSRLLPQEKKALTKKIKHFIRHNHTTTLRDLAARISLYHKTNLIQIVRPEKNTLLLKIQKRAPFMTIELKNRHYLSNRGHIYSKINKAHKNLVNLKGIESSKVSIIPGGLYQLEEKTHKIIKEAIDLKMALDAQNIAIKDITFDKYRGLRVTTKKDLVVVFGRAPFGPRIKRLRKTLTRLKAKDVEASYIELDYVGKAFIKEKVRNF